MRMSQTVKRCPFAGQVTGLYDLEQAIGAGNFATVHKARHVFTGTTVAVKAIEKAKLDDACRSALYNEVRCIKLVQHPYVIRLYDVIDTNTKLYLVLELADTDMFHYISSLGRGLDEVAAARYFSQVVGAVSYCHKLHVIHRDLKAENVLYFSAPDIVKLTDFGFSHVWHPNEPIHSNCGSLTYSAPEVLLGDAHSGQAADVWSLGIILYMFVTGMLPFLEQNESETLTKILDCHFTIPLHVSQTCADLVRLLLVRDTRHRLTLPELCHHAWLTEMTRGDVTDDFSSSDSSFIPESCQSQVIHWMEQGGVARRSDIMSALKADEYSHVTATYYLLAERLLRSMPTPAVGTSSVIKETKAGAGSTPASPQPTSPVVKGKLRQSSHHVQPTGHKPILLKAVSEVLDEEVEHDFESIHAKGNTLRHEATDSEIDLIVERKGEVIESKSLSAFHSVSEHSSGRPSPGPSKYSSKQTPTSIASSTLLKVRQVVSSQSYRKQCDPTEALLSMENMLPAHHSCPAICSEDRSSAIATDLMAKKFPPQFTGLTVSNTFVNVE